MQFSLPTFVTLAAALTSLAASPSLARPGLAGCSHCTANRCDRVKTYVDWGHQQQEKTVHGKHAVQWKYDHVGQLKVTVIDEPNGHQKLSVKKINGDNAYKLSFNVTGQDDFLDIYVYKSCKLDLGPIKIENAKLYAQRG